jgi:hypothetical protein
MYDVVFDQSLHPHSSCVTPGPLQCDQLLELMSLLPADATQDRVELVTMTWARLTDRARRFTDVLRHLSNEQQVGVVDSNGATACFEHVQGYAQARST